jgi:adenine C2-methylase RlmN of 23S rRNA A2503 and tRNA A37
MMARVLLQGDLTSGEIIEQLVHARALSPIRNVVFMGMGVRGIERPCDAVVSLP